MSALLFRRELCWAQLAAKDARQVLERLARELTAQGLVHPSFEAAVLQREQVSPTGLPMPRRKVAIPHSDPEHVITAAVALCSLATPVTFCEMGNPHNELPVELVAMLALPDKEQCQQQLVQLIGLFQDASLLDRLCQAPDGESIYSLLTQESP